MLLTDELPLEIPPEGVTIPDFPLVLLKVLGRGGQGIVYLGHRPTMDRPEVVKFPDISPEAPNAIEDFQREIRALSKLQCESIVRIYIVDILRTPRLIGRPYFTMEYVDGGSLRKRLRGEPLPVRQALTTAIEIAEALSAAHAAGIVHRDIKPQNVLLTRDGKAKLIDFGLARLINESKRHTAGFIRGTPKYISPEAARAEIVGPPGDLYSLGALLFEMLTGRPPFEGSEYDLMLHHATTPAPSLRDIGRGGPFPPELEGLMRGLLAKNPYERPQSAGELRRALEGIRRLLPDATTAVDDDVDAQDPTISAAVATVHRQYPVAIAATVPGAVLNAPPTSSPRVYSADAPTVDEPVPTHGATSSVTAASISGRAGIVARGAPPADESVATLRDRPTTPARRAPQRSSRAALLLVPLLLLLSGASAAAFFLLRKPEGRAPLPVAPTPTACATAQPPPSSAMPPPTHESTSATATSTAVATSPPPSTPPPGVKGAKPVSAAKAGVKPPLGAASTPATVPTPTTTPAATPPPTKSPIDDRF